MSWGKTSNITARIGRSSIWPIRIEGKGCSEAFRIVYIGLFELCTRTLDILLHEQQFLHSRKLLCVCWARERTTQVVDR